MLFVGMQAARLVPMRDSTFAAYMGKKRSESKHFNVARSHVGKKLVRVISIAPICHTIFYYKRKYIFN